jgi:hypothetical protein
MSLVEDSDPEFSENGSDVFLARYQLAASETPPSILPVPRNTLVTFDQGSILNRQRDGNWTLTTILKFLNVGQRAKTFSIRIPATLTKNLEILSSTQVNATKKLSNSSIEITFENLQTNSGDLPIVLKSSLTAHPSGDWQLPTIDVVDANMKNHFLVLSPENHYVPAKNESHTKLTSETLPSWIRKSISRHTKATNPKVYQSVSQVWNLVKQSAKIFNPKTHVPLVQTWVSLDRTNTEFGYTELFFLSGIKHQLELTWPDNLTLRALSVNGTQISSQSVAENILVVPVASVSRMNRIQLFWSCEVKGMSSLFWSLTPKYPMPKNVQVGRSLMTLIPSSQTLLFATGDFTRLDSRQHARERLEGLLEAARENYESGGDQTEIWSLLDRSFRRYTFHFEETGFSEQTVELSAQSRNYDQIKSEIESLLPASGPPRERPNFEDDRVTLFDLGMYRMTDQAANREQFIGRLPVDDTSGPMTIWIVRDALVHWSMAAIGFLLALFVLRKVCTLQTADLLNAHPPVAWMLMGLFWWLCLKPSGIGLGLLLMVILTAVRQFQQRKSKTVEQPAA